MSRKIPLDTSQAKSHLIPPRKWHHVRMTRRCLHAVNSPLTNLINPDDNVLGKTLYSRSNKGPPSPLCLKNPQSKNKNPVLLGEVPQEVPCGTGTAGSGGAKPSTNKQTTGGEKNEVTTAGRHGRGCSRPKVEPGRRSNPRCERTDS